MEKFEMTKEMIAKVEYEYNFLKKWKEEKENNPSDWVEATMINTKLATYEDLFKIFGLKFEDGKIKNR